MFSATFTKLTTTEIHLAIKIPPLTKIEIVHVSLFKEKKKISELTNLEQLVFKNLSANTKYKVKITYLIAEGLEELSLEAITRAEPIEIKDFHFLVEDYYLDYQENCQVLLTVNNPSEVNIKSVAINEVDCQVLSKKNNKIKLQLPLASFAGKTTFKVTKVIYQSYKQTLFQDIKESPEQEKHVLAELIVCSLKEIKRAHYLLRSADVKFVLSLDNKSLYPIKAVSLRINNIIHTFSGPDLEVISPEEIIINYQSSKVWASFLTASVFDISYQDFNNKLITKNISYVYTSFYRVKSLETRSITTIEELQELENGYIYSLSNDICGKGFNWKPYEFVGVILGNGFTIKNVDIVVDEEKTKADIGLFSEFKGVMEKISFKDFNFYIDNEQSLFIGGIVGRSYRPLIFKNIEAINFNFKVKNANEVNLGTLVGYQDKYGSFENIVIKDVVVEIENVNNAKLGGIIGFSDGYNVLKEMFVYKFIGNIDAGGEVYLGALIGYGYKNDIHRSLVVNSYLSGNTTTGMFSYSDGFVGASHQTVFHNLYFGDDVTILTNKYHFQVLEKELVHFDKLDQQDFYLKQLIFKQEDWNVSKLNYVEGVLPKLIAFIK